MNVLCVERAALKCAKDVQKKVHLEDLLLNHTKYTEEGKDYVPLDVCVSVRSVYTNKVLRTPDNKLYTNVTSIGEYIHKGYDLIMYLASVAFMSCINWKPELNDLMMKSEFQCIGLFNPDPDVIRPIVVCHILLDDSIVGEIEKCLFPDYVFEDITEAKQKYAVENIKYLTDTLVIVNKQEEDYE